jgi:hypothetical protein
MWGGSLAGPKVVPGDYRVRLKIDGKAVGERSFKIAADPRLGAIGDGLSKQFALHSQITRKLSDTHNAILEIRDLRQQLEGVSKRLSGPENKPLTELAGKVIKELTSIEEALIQTKIKSSQDALNFPIRLNNKLAALGALVGGSDAAPTAQSYQVFEDLSKQIDAELARLAALKAGDIADFNRQFNGKGLPVISPREPGGKGP